MYRLYQKKLYNLVWAITKKVKIAWVQEFRQYSKILLAVCSFLNDVIPLLESKYMLNLVIEGKNKLGNFSQLNFNSSTNIIDWNTELARIARKWPNLFFLWSSYLPSLGFSQDGFYFPLVIYPALALARLGLFPTGSFFCQSAWHLRD